MKTSIDIQISDKSLEEAARRYQEGVIVDTTIYYCGACEDVYFANRIADAFIAGAEWQAEQDKEIIELAEDHAFLAGSNWQEEQMMKEAVEGYVTLTMTGIPTVATTIKEGDNIGVGDKVHIIVCKKEDKK